jgi:hypothetical protein
MPGSALVQDYHVQMALQPKALAALQAAASSARPASLAVTSRFDQSGESLAISLAANDVGVRIAGIDSIIEVPLKGADAVADDVRPHPLHVAAPSRREAGEELVA